MLNNFIYKNISLVSILLFLILYLTINLIKPNFMYDNKGNLREFGIGYKKKTVLPSWLISIIVAIMSYYLVLYYITYC